MGPWGPGLGLDELDELGLLGGRSKSGSRARPGTTTCRVSLGVTDVLSRRDGPGYARPSTSHGNRSIGRTGASSGTGRRWSAAVHAAPAAASASARTTALPSRPPADARPCPCAWTRSANGPPPPVPRRPDSAPRTGPCRPDLKPRHIQLGQRARARHQPAQWWRVGERGHSKGPGVPSPSSLRVYAPHPDLPPTS